MEGNAKIYIQDRLGFRVFGVTSNIGETAELKVQITNQGKFDKGYPVELSLGGEPNTFLTAYKLSARFKYKLQQVLPPSQVQIEQYTQGIEKTFTNVLYNKLEPSSAQVESTKSPGTYFPAPLMIIPQIISDVLTCLYGLESDKAGVYYILAPDFLEMDGLAYVSTPKFIRSGKSTAKGWSTEKTRKIALQNFYKRLNLSFGEADAVYNTQTKQYNMPDEPVIVFTKDQMIRRAYSFPSSPKRAVVFGTQRSHDLLSMIVGLQSYDSEESLSQQPVQKITVADQRKIERAYQMNNPSQLDQRLMPAYAKYARAEDKKKEQLSLFKSPKQQAQSKRLTFKPPQTQSSGILGSAKKLEGERENLWQCFPPLTQLLTSD